MRARWRSTPRRARRVAIVIDPNPQRRLALLAARFYGRQPQTIAAVTGTNGKTSVAHFTREIWTALGHPGGEPRHARPGVRPTGRRPGALTTPDPVALHRDLAELAGGRHRACRDRGVEPRSRAVPARRHRPRRGGVHQSDARPSRLSRRHGNRTARRNGGCSASCCCPSGAAVLNADSPEFAALAALCRERGLDVIRFGHEPGSELRIVERVPLPSGQRLAIEVFGERSDIDLPLVGEFQASNVLAALGLVIATGAAPREARCRAAAARAASPDGCSSSETGARPPSGAAVFVDYAHTPDALATVLTRAAPAYRAAARRRVRRRRRPRPRQAAADGAASRPISPISSMSPTTIRAARIRRRSAARFWRRRPAPSRSATAARRSARRSRNCAAATCS